MNEHTVSSKDTSTLWWFLRQVRRASGISQREVGLSQCYVSEVERGLHPDVSVRTVAKLSDAIGYELVLRKKS